MKYDPMERRERIYALMVEDEEYLRMREECEKGRKWFVKFTDRLPWVLRNRLWNYPGMFYLMHHRMLNRICEEMRFPEEC